MHPQFAAVQNFYMSILEKRASEEGLGALTPDYKKDSREVALDEIEANKKDQRKELGNLLTAAKSEESADTKEMKKALPEAADAEEVSAGSPLIKIAMNQAFFAGLRQVEHLKIASADYMKVIYSAFNDELEKIAGAMGAAGELFSMKGPGKIMAGLGKAMPRKPPPIPAAAMKPTSWAPGSTITGRTIAGGMPGMGGSASITFPK